MLYIRLFLLPMLVFSIFYAKEKELEKATLQLAWKHQWQFAGYYMAKEKGFYQDAGFIVEIKEFETGMHITHDVESGKVDFGVGRSSLIYDRSKGRKIIMLASILQHSPVILLTKERKDLQTIADLKGKDIMLTQDQVGMASINAMLFSKGVKPDDYKFRQHSFNVQDLIDGKTDALLAYISNEPYEMRRQELPYTIFSPREYNFDFLSDILFTSQSLLDTNPDKVKRFRQASLLGWKYAIEHPEETTKLILQKYNSQNKSKEALAFESEEIIKLTDYPHVTLGEIDLKRVEYITQVYRLMGLIESDFSLEDLVYDKGVENTVGFSNEEVLWLKNNPVIMMGGEMDWPPFDYVDNTGVYQGIIKDYIELFEAKSGVKFDVKTGMSWKELVAALKNREIDFLPALYTQSEERKKFGTFTKPYLKVKNVMFVRDDEKQIKKLEDIKKHRVAVIKGYATVNSYAPHLDDAEIITVNSLIDAIYAVLNNQADAFMDSQLVVEYTMNKNLISGLKPIFLPSRPTDSQLHMLIRNDKPILHSIIQKLLDSVTLEEERMILDKWIFSGSLNFTAKEQAWIDKSTPIRYVFDPDWRPIEWASELGEHQGVLSDVIALLEQKSGIDFKPIAIDKWSKAQTMVANREVDMYSGVGETLEREKFMHFTQNKILTAPYVYVSRLEEDYLEGLESIGNRRVAVTENSTIQARLTEEYPGIKPTVVTTYEEGFDLLMNKSTDLFIVNMALAKYYINYQHFGQLKITGKPGLNLDLKIAIRNDWPPEVISIIDKALEAITTKELNDIIYKWTEVKVQETTDWGFILKILAGVGLIILGILYWNRTMAREIAKRKQAEASLSQAMEALQISHEKISDSIQYASLIQHAILPDQEMLQQAFHESLTIWEPKNIVGGDIFLVEQLGNDHEYLIMVVDCTGHGVPGAFMTMLVKAIEQTILSELSQEGKEVHPAEILQVFNRSIRTLLKQDSSDAKSNAGFDGGILYINKQTRKIRFSGAETPLFYFDKTDGLKMIKGDRHGVGYCKSDPDYVFTEHELDIGNLVSLFITTDGYLDQNGGEKEFPFGKKRFQGILKENFVESLAKQKPKLLEELASWQQENERNDDVTVIGIRF